MARIQVLPLPAETVGSVTSTPFVLIIDRLGGEFPADMLPFALEPAGMQEKIGYRAALIFDGELTVANVDEKLHEAAQAAVMRALCPEQTVEA